MLVLATHINGDKAEYWLNADNWYKSPDNLQKFTTHAYNLLFPLAKAGYPFEPPFIQLHTDEDLELVYTQLRSVAAYSQMPFAEDGEV